MLADRGIGLVGLVLVAALGASLADHLPGTGIVGPSILWMVLAGSLAGLSPSQRLKAGREMADRLGVVLAAIERDEIDASATETARLQASGAMRVRRRGAVWVS